MAIVISSKNQEKTFSNKDIINIGSNSDCDFNVNMGIEFLLTVQCEPNANGFVVLNPFKNDKILFKGQPLAQRVAIESVCKFAFADSDDFICIKTVKETAPVAQYDAEKGALEQERAAIIKQTGFAINDIKNRLSLNYKSSLFLHIALFFSSLVTAFGLSNYLTGLPIKETGNFINLPVNIKILFVFTFIVFGLGLALKQGVFLYFQNKYKQTPSSVTAQNFMLGLSGIFFAAIYIVNLMYYNGINVVFGLFVSLFFVGLTAFLASACGYFKNTGHAMSFELDKYEYREDFEAVMSKYRAWIDKYINGLSNTKIENIKDKIFNLKLKSFGEILAGVLTAPFLAYGVSNTLAMCFPEAAGWVRISGLRFSPVFLVLATCLIIFAFFAFVNAFLSIRKIQGSDVIKQDGFSNYLEHGVDIYGVRGARKLETEKVRSLVIGCSIIFIEFTMNTSYFFTTIGGDLNGILLSLIAALVPTALLIAETYMLSQTKFYINACDELISKLDRN